MNISLSGTAPAAVEWTLGYSTVDFGSATTAAGPAATAANKQVSCNNNAGSAKCILWGMNTTTMSSGVVATVTLPINHTTDSSSTLQLTGGAAAAATGAVLATSTSGASVTIQPGLSGFTCSPVSIASPAISACTVTLTAAAPAGGAAIAVTANPSSAVTLSTPVTVPAGSLSKPFNVTAAVVAASTPVMLTASYLGVNQGFGITVTPPVAPQISSLSPTSATVGTAVTIAGTNFGATQGASTVTFHGTAATPTSWGATSIAVPVPAGATSGSVIVTVGGVASNGVSFNVVPQPSAVSVSPNSGSGASSTFTFVFTDSQNAANMTGLGMLFSSSPTTFANACALFYDGTAGVLGLRWDNGQGQDYRAVAAQTVLQNSQCIIGASTYTATGPTMTIALNIAFKAGFTGAANIYMYASDYAYGTNTGWVQRGTFTVLQTPAISSLSPASGATGTAVTITGTNFGATQGSSTVTFNGTAATPTSWSATSIVAPVPAGATTGNVVVTVNAVASNGAAFTVLLPTPQPSAVSVSPNNGSGASQTFTFVFTDSQNVANMTGLGMLFSSSPTTFTNACDLFYDGTGQVLGLRWDNGQGQDYRAVSAQTPLQNSQCVIGTSTYTITGTTMTIALNIAFKGAFDGAANIYMYASDYSYGVNTGWVQRGTFTVGAATTPVVNSVTPSSGSGASQRFTITASDAGGGNLINNVSVLFAPTFNLVGACYLVYDGNANTISLGYENPANGATPVTPGSSAVASNNQCNLQASDSTVTSAANTITLTLDLTFNGSFAGAKNIYVSAGVPGYNSGWATAGTWTVTAGTPTADSVTPTSGSGSTVRLTFVGSDSVTQTNITGMTMLVTGGSTATSTANACYLVYDRNAATIGLYDDTGTVLVGAKGIGYSTQLKNSQCAVGYTLMTKSGNSVQFLLELFFSTPAFDGAKTVYFQTNEASGNSGMVPRGTWTVQ